jgi:hypothetical protein
MSTSSSTQQAKPYPLSLDELKLLDRADGQDIINGSRLIKAMKLEFPAVKHAMLHAAAVCIQSHRLRLCITAVYTPDLIVAANSIAPSSLWLIQVVYTSTLHGTTSDTLSNLVLKPKMIALETQSGDVHNLIQQLIKDLHTLIASNTNGQGFKHASDLILSPNSTSFEVTLKQVTSDNRIHTQQLYNWALTKHITVPPTMLYSATPIGNNTGSIIIPVLGGVNLTVAKYTMLQEPVAIGMWYQLDSLQTWNQQHARTDLMVL